FAGAASSAPTSGRSASGGVRGSLGRGRGQSTDRSSRSRPKQSDAPTPILISMIADMASVSAPFRLPETPVRSDLVAKYFRGLGDPTRVRILELLRDEGELSVGALAHRLGQPQPKVSNHLACLRWCGFVAARREHRTVYNRIADRRVVDMLGVAQALL